MPKIEVDRKTGEVNIEGDCGAEWDGTCGVVKVTKDKIILNCETELTKECPEGEKRKIEDYDTTNPYEMMQQVIDHGWAQMTDFEIVNYAMDELDAEYPDKYFWYEEEGDLYRIVEITPDNEKEAELNLFDIITEKGWVSTDHAILAKRFVDTLNKEGLAAEFTTHETYVEISLIGYKKG